MDTQGAFVILSNEKHQILLVKRKDVPLWDLPGGRVDLSETAEAAAVREVLEETGYNAMLSAKIGVYQRPKFQDEQYVFAGKHNRWTSNCKRHGDSRFEVVFSAAFAAFYGAKPKKANQRFHEWCSRCKCHSQGLRHACGD